MRRGLEQTDVCCHEATVQLNGLWATGVECVEESGNVEEVELAVAIDVSDRILSVEAVEECRNIEEVQVTIAGEVSNTDASAWDLHCCGH